MHNDEKIPNWCLTQSVFSRVAPDEYFFLFFMRWKNVSTGSWEIQKLLSRLGVLRSNNTW